MTLSQQTAQNREKIIAQYSRIAIKDEDYADGYRMEPAGPVLDTLTEETWKAAEEAMLERVREKLDELKREKPNERWSGEIAYHFALNNVYSFLAALKELTSERTNS